MDIDKFGILITVVIVGTVLGFGGITSGEYGFSGLEIPELVTSEPIKPTNSGQSDSYYEWCYKMGLEC